MAKDIYEGVVRDEVVDTRGGDYTYQLQLDYESIEGIFRMYQGQKIKVTIEICDSQEIPF